MSTVYFFIADALLPVRQERFMDNPYEHDDRDGLDRDEDVKFCRGCQGMIPDPSQGQYWNGWDWCLDCIKTVQPVVEDLARSHRMDEDRDDFNQVRR